MIWNFHFWNFQNLRSGTLIGPFIICIWNFHFSNFHNQWLSGTLIGPFHHLELSFMGTFINWNWSKISFMIVPIIVTDNEISRDKNSNTQTIVPKKIAAKTPVQSWNLEKMKKFHLMFMLCSNCSFKISLMKIPVVKY